MQCTTYLDFCLGRMKIRIQDKCLELFADGCEVLLNGLVQHRQKLGIVGMRVMQEGGHSLQHRLCATLQARLAPGCNRNAVPPSLHIIMLD